VGFLLLFFSFLYICHQVRVPASKTGGQKHTMTARRINEGSLALVGFLSFFVGYLLFADQRLGVLDELIDKHGPRSCYE
jgi:hypothetical protein